MGQTDGICTAEGCEKQRFRRSFCTMHYSRLMRRGTLELPVTAPAERFWSKVKFIPEGCWESPVPPSRRRLGYVQIRMGGQRVQAHRWAYEQVMGPIPEGLVLDHLCRNPCCVNPRHLEPVTNEVNILRGYAPSAMNARKTHCIHGHPLEGDNLIPYFLAKGERKCRECARAWKRKYRTEQRYPTLAKAS